MTRGTVEVASHAGKLHGPIFEAWLSFHQLLKDKYYLRPEDEDSDEFETSRMNVLLVNPKGVFAVGVLRSVNEYKRFTAFGSGCDYAIGAMRADRKSVV